MAMLGMQAEMQCHYLPGYCSTRDLNLNSNWPLNNVDVMAKNGHYNGNLARPYPDEYLACKEQLKRTILQHEAIFKNQIHELHRLYKRQRELMNEMRKMKVCGPHLQLETLPSNQILSGNSFWYSQNMCRFSVVPWQNPAWNPSSVSRAENNQSHLGHFKGTIKQLNSVTVQAEVCREESELLESKFKKVGKKILDLELPADEYIDGEQEETLAHETNPLEGQSYSAKSIVKDVQKNYVKISHAIEDGNVAFPDDNKTRALGSTRTTFLADLNEPIKLEEETDPESNDFATPLLNHGVTPCHDTSEQTKSDTQVQQKETMQMTRMIEDPKASSNVLHLEKKENSQKCLPNNEAGKACAWLDSFPERTCTETLSTSSKDNGIELILEKSTSHVPNPCIKRWQKKIQRLGSESYPWQVTAACKNFSMEEDAIDCKSSLGKHEHENVMSPMAIQGLPCLSRSSKFSNPQVTPEEILPDINVESKAKLQSSKARSSFCNGEGKLASEDDGTKIYIKNIDLNCASPGCSDLATHSTWSNDGEEISLLHKSNLAYCVDTSKNLELNSTSVLDTGEQLSENEPVSQYKIDQKFSGSGFPVDLNSHVNEEPSLLCSSPAAIDLRVPAVPENERSPPRSESYDNQCETLSLPSKQENSDLVEDLVTIAAEAMVAISSSRAQINNTKNMTFKSFEAAKYDPLHWFAKLASCVVDDPESEYGVVLSCKEPYRHNECPSDEIDYFEAMTLKLKDLKEEECCCRASVQKEVASLPSQLRRGRLRRGRQQWKDFQNEILPSLASLSRYEVTEDLQAIGGLIEAARRSTGTRTGKNGWTLGGRRGRTSASSSKSETVVCALLKQQSRHGECRIEDWCLIGWGKKTRRRRRGHRSPASSNPWLILSQQV